MALEFISGNMTYVDLGDKFDFNYTDARTFVFRINKTSLTGSQAIIAKQDIPTAYPGWIVYVSDQKIRFQYVVFYPVNCYDVETTNDEITNTNQWYSVAVVYNNKSVIFCVNAAVKAGTLKRDNLSSNITTDIHCYIGASVNVTKPFDGLINDLRIYDRVLSPTEIRIIHYAQGADNIVDGLVGRWLINEKPDGTAAAGASSVIDISGNGNHGTPVNSPIYRGAPMRLINPVILTKVARTYTQSLSCKLGLKRTYESTFYGTEKRNLGFKRNFEYSKGIEILRKLGFKKNFESTFYESGLQKLGLKRNFLSILHGIDARNLGLKRNFESILYGILIRKLGLKHSFESILYESTGLTLGLKRNFESILYGILIRKLGLKHSFESILYESTSLTLGFKRSFESILYGTLSLKLGFKYSFIVKVLKFYADIYFYNSSGELVKIISTKAQNHPLIDAEWTTLKQGGCGAFKLRASRDLNLEKGYIVKIHLFQSDIPWYTGRLKKVPDPGTQQIYEYSGFGIFDELDWQLINEVYEDTELSVIVKDLLSKYYYDKSDILEES